MLRSGWSFLPWVSEPPRTSGICIREVSDALLLTLFVVFSAEKRPLATGLRAVLPRVLINALQDGAQSVERAHNDLEDIQQLLFSRVYTVAQVVARQSHAEVELHQ